MASLRRAARERGGPLPSIDVAEALRDERRELTEWGNQIAQALAHLCGTDKNPATGSQRRPVHHAAAVETRPGGMSTATRAARLARRASTGVWKLWFPQLITT